MHHEARLLPNGRMAVLGAIERILTDVQGPGESAVYSVASDTFTYRSHRLFNLYVTPPEWGTTHTLTLLEFLSGIP